ncbi:MAG: hypothetical protein JWL77_5195 [Chthonomonadaceae bacterium]|nr:hypothetical protein [Chthonomonadaceae bacterium]
MGLLWAATISRAAADGAQSVTVPLIQRGVHLYVDATIDDKPVLMVLDTGAGANILTPRAAKRLDLMSSKGQINVQGAGGDAAPASAVKIGKLGVGEAMLKAQSAYVIPLPDVLVCDGLLGTPFFRAWIVQFDYAHLRLTLTPRSTFQPPADATAVPIHFYNNIPALDATVDGIKGRFKIDTGAGDAVTLFGPFVEKQHLRGKYSPSLQTVTGRGIGGLLYGDLVRLPEFVIGPFRFTRVAAELSRQTEGAFAGTESAGNLGGEIWERFTLILDYPDNKIFLIPNAHYDSPFIANRSGLALDTDQGMTVIRAVIPDSPATEAGIHEGDIVLAIDGTSIFRIEGWKVRDILRGDPGKKIVLHLRAPDKTERDTTLTLRDLL